MSDACPNLSIEPKVSVVSFAVQKEVRQQKVTKTKIRSWRISQAWKKFILKSLPSEELEADL